MPSSQLVADAAIITPYLTHRTTHHGQTTLIPPDNAGRIRKGKRKKSRQRQDRIPRPDEEIRFNVGSPRPLLQPAHLRGRRPARSGGHHGGRDHDFHEGALFLSGMTTSLPQYRLSSDITIPDYPPPSFQEAISTPTPGTPLGTTQTPPQAFVNNSQGHPPPPLSDPRPQPRAQERSRATPTATESLAVNVSDSDSEAEESSLEVVELEPSQTQWEEDRALGLTLEQRVRREFRRRMQEDSTPSLSSQDRSQTASELEGRNRPGRGVLESDSEDEGEAYGNALPAAAPVNRSYLSPLRALSLLPNKASHDRILSSSSPSPYTVRSGHQLLKSTTSLGRLPKSNSTPSIRGESSVSRKLFASKGKERLQIEPLDSWEFVDSDVPSSPLTPPKSSGKFTFPSPQRLFERNTPHIPLSPFMGSQDQPIPRSPTSLKDQKVSFLNRQVRREVGPPSPSRLASSTPPSSPILTNCPAIPSLRIPEPKHTLARIKKKDGSPSSPLSKDHERPAELSPNETATSRLGRVLETSPPPTPSDIYPGLPASVTTSSDHEMGHSHVIDVNSSRSAVPFKVPTQMPPSEQVMVPPNLKIPGPLNTAQQSVYRHYLFPIKPPQSRYALSPERALRHYPGRPLPNPPPIPARQCPEGLLIDLGEDANESSAVPERVFPNTRSNPKSATLPNQCSGTAPTHHPPPLVTDYAEFDPLTTNPKNTSSRPLSGTLQSLYVQPHAPPIPTGTPTRVRWTADA